MPRNKYIPLGYEELTGLSAAKGLANPKLAEASRAVIRVEGQNARFRDDGTAPTAALGILLATTDVQPFVYEGNCSALQFIEVALSAVIHVSLYRE